MDCFLKSYLLELGWVIHSSEIRGVDKYKKTVAERDNKDISLDIPAVR
jgi:hypothetical protein|tara:strand:- start:176 stop:319 length:144 start_codon:yes stop_codon:yes gene_type:complete